MDAAGPAASYHDEIQPGWSSMLLLDIFKNHFYPAIQYNVDRLSCRSVCKMWLMAFSFPRIEFPIRSILSAAKYGKNIMCHAEELIVQEAVSKYFDLYCQIVSGAQLNCKKISITSIFDKSIFEKDGTIFGSKIPNLRVLEVYSLYYGDPASAAGAAKIVPQILSVVGACYSTIEELHLNDIYLDSDASTALFSSLRRCSNFRSLSSSILAPSLPHLAELMKSTNRIKSLQLSVKEGTKDSFRDFHAAIAASASLEHLQIGLYDDNHIESLLSSLEGQKSVKSLNVTISSGNDLLHVVKYLSSSKRLETLSCLCFDQSIHAPELLGRFFHENRSVKKFEFDVMSGGELDWSNMIHSGLSHNNRLTTLNFAELPELNLEQLLDAVIATGRPPLQKLVLFCTSLVSSYHKLLHMIQQRPSFWSLSLLTCNCATGTEFAERLSNLLETNTGLRALTISQCGFGDAGLRLICDAVAKNQGLRSFVLAEETPLCYTLDALTWMIKNNTTLQKLKIDGLSVPATRRSDFELALRKNAGLSVCQVHFDSFPGDTIDLCQTVKGRLG